MEEIRNRAKNKRIAKEREKKKRKEMAILRKASIAQARLKEAERRIEKARLREIKKQEATQLRIEKARLREIKKQEVAQRKIEKARLKEIKKQEVAQRKALGVSKDTKLSKEERKSKMIKKLLEEVEDGRDYELSHLEVKETQYRLLNLNNALKRHLLEKDVLIEAINTKYDLERTSIYKKYNLTEKD
jgi:hypothetical protein